MNTSPPLFDPVRIAKNRHRAQSRFSNHDFLHQRIWQDLIERASLIERKFIRTRVLGELIPNFSEIGKPDWIRSLKLDAETHKLDLLMSFLQLHLANDLRNDLLCCRKALKPDGVFLGALFGGYTLTELRQSLFAAECELTNGAASRIAPFVDVKTLGSLVQAAGFSLPVIDVDTVIVRYKTLQSLMHDLRYMGEANPVNSPVRPLSRAVLTRTEEIYRERFADSNNLLPARFDILHICGWAPHESQQQALKPGSGKVFLGDALKKAEE